jgi:hypothetical protein
LINFRKILKILELLEDIRGAPAHPLTAIDAPTLTQGDSMNIRQFGFAAAVVAAGWAMLTVRAAADEHRRDSDGERIRVGFEIAPVPLNFRDKDPALVGLGSHGHHPLLPFRAAVQWRPASNHAMARLPKFHGA